MCSLKSRNRSFVAMFEPADLLIRHPFSTSQLEAFGGLSNVQPAKSRPLNRVSGLSHFGFVGGLSAGARLPVQVQAVAFGPRAEPDKVPPVSFPSKAKSFVLPSSSLGLTNSIRSPLSTTFGKSRALPHRPTKRAFQTPRSSDSSSQDGSLWPFGSLTVRSQRPAKESAGAAQALAPGIKSKAIAKTAVVNRRKHSETNDFEMDFMTASSGWFSQTTLELCEL